MANNHWLLLGHFGFFLLKNNNSESCAIDYVSDTVLHPTYINSSIPTKAIRERHGRNPHLTGEETVGQKNLCRITHLSCVRARIWTLAIWVWSHLSLTLLPWYQPPVFLFGSFSDAARILGALNSRTMCPSVGLSFILLKAVGYFTLKSNLSSSWKNVSYSCFLFLWLIPDEYWTSCINSSLFLLSQNPLFLSFHLDSGNFP